MKYFLVVLLQAFLSCYQPYPACPGADTPAPKGYEPFYISQFSRHGSRYYEKADMAMTVMGPLAKAAVDGNLTPEGGKLLSAIRFLDSSTDGHYGALAPLGEREQYGIGRRIAARYPAVFSGRDSLVCASSVATRCIMSMNYWLGGLFSVCGPLVCSYASNYKDQLWINPVAQMKKIYAMNNPAVEADFKENFDFDGFCARIFADPAAGKALIKTPVTYMRYLWLFFADAVCMELPGVKAEDYLTPAEVEALWRNYNLYLNLNFGDSADSWPIRRQDMKATTGRIVADADRALSLDSRVAMDVRFGHDSGLMSLMTALGAPGFAGTVASATRGAGFAGTAASATPAAVRSAGTSAASTDASTADVDAAATGARSAWNSDEIIPMASNLLLVFYRHSSKPEILVKVLYNENEVALPSLGKASAAVSGKGVYYPWPAFRSMLTE